MKTEHQISPKLTKGLHQDIIERLKTERIVEVAGTGNPFSKSFFINYLFQSLSQTKAVWLVQSKAHALEILQTVPFIGETPFILFDGEKNAEVVQKRILSFLEILSNDAKEICVVTPEFLGYPCPSRASLEKEMLCIVGGDEIAPFDLFEKLLHLGYIQSEDKVLEEGSYNNVGDTLRIRLPNIDDEYRITFLGDMIEDIALFSTKDNKVVQRKKELNILPMKFQDNSSSIINYIEGDQVLCISDELETLGEEYDNILEEVDSLRSKVTSVRITSFPETEDFFHLRYLSLLKYYTQADFLNDIKERYIAGWSTIIYTKEASVVRGLFLEQDILFVTNWKDLLTRRGKQKPATLIIDLEEDVFIPHSFQNAQEKLAVITDREIVLGKKERRMVRGQGNAMMAFLASLKKDDYVVHADHGIGKFVGIDKKSIDSITREYLEIHYASNDKLFIPTDQADKISKYISNDDNPPKLTRLDSTEWTSLNKKVKKEAEKIAKELLELFAERELATGHAYKTKLEVEEAFAETFPYTETPGQLKAIHDVLRDMETDKPMDRLVCGDVGFGKTEVAMRASFRAFLNNKQVALISPITILADQHFKSFQKRMDEFGVKIEMLSRFKSPKEQRIILDKLAHGEVDIVVGTHRLLQKDVVFKDLGLIVIDEEQRFGVKQKEKLREMRANVDVLTLSATPIPRTLHMSLNNLRDITTITTPPPGRLPVITEVRKYSDALVVEAIMNELDRGGQVYFLHNKVRTIESVALKLRKLAPKARILVAHGQLDPRELERRIFAFKNGEYDVLVSSTIVENGIDLPNANTLIVNNADAFGLSQLYQLRGRVGRSRTQAYSYLLYSTRKLKSDAKKRLRAIVEASELGSGFQIAMKDLEIRGAGDILGSSQHGMMNSVGVSHFIRMLNQQVEELRKRGTTKRKEKHVDLGDISVDIPLTAYIPDWYIPEYEEKIRVYQTFSSLKSLDEVKEYMAEITSEYGDLPDEIKHIGTVLELKIMARRAHISKIKVYNQPFGLQEVNLVMDSTMKPEHIFSLLTKNNKWFISDKTLKIKLQDLSPSWLDGIKESLFALSKLPDKLK